MNIDTSNLLNSILEELSSLSYVHPGDVPNIDLYMDQVTTLWMNSWLRPNVTLMIRS